MEGNFPERKYISFSLFVWKCDAIIGNINIHNVRFKTKMGSTKDKQILQQKPGDFDTFSHPHLLKNYNLKIYTYLRSTIKN